MSTEPSAKDYQKIKKNYKKMLVKGIKISPKKKKKKKVNIDVNSINILQMRKSKGSLNIEKTILRNGKKNASQ